MSNGVEWVNTPDKDGWWWYYENHDLSDLEALTIVHVKVDPDPGMIGPWVWMATSQRAMAVTDSTFRGVWLFQEAPEDPV